MLTINKVTKIYNIKKKNEVIALKDIDLSFENKNLVFVVGSSGSGKTTLMNIIGGIESPTNGNVQINNKNIGNTEKELEIYRNKYIGLVFKDNNLIDNITIYENLSLVCQEKEKIENYLEKLGLKKYENRYPNELEELSGGQIQKIAIARSLLKEAEILLLDEPTWNLNEQTNKEIYELLKEIAKEKLVIVFTQNKKDAEEYADRIIELEDGIVVADKTINKSENKLEIKEKEKKKINKDNLLKLVLNNIKTNKCSTIINMLIMCLCFICASICFSIVDYNRIDADIKNLKTIDEIETFTLEYNNRTNNLSYSQVEQIKEKFPEMKYIQDGVINSSQDIIDLGMEFYDNYNEIKDDGIYIFEYKVQEAIDKGKLFYDENGVNVIKKTDEINYENLSNTYLLLENSNYKKYLRIDGIIKNFIEPKQDNNFNNVDEEAKYHINIQLQENLNIFYLKNSSYYNCFAKELGRETTLSDFNFGPKKVSINNIKFNKFSFYFSNILFSDSGISSNCGSIILTNDKVIDTNEKSFHVENENEVYISLLVYNKIFKEVRDFKSFLDVNEDGSYIIKNYPNHLGEKISLDIVDFYFEDYKLNYKDLIFKGLILDLHPTDHLQAGSVLLSDNKFNEIYEFTCKPNIYIKKSSINNISLFVKECSKLSVVPSHYLTDTIEMDISKDQQIVMYFMIGFILISFLIMYLYSNKTINKKELGILKSIGFSNKDLINMFNILIGFISAILIVLVLPLSCLSIYILNKIGAVAIYSLLKIFFYKWWYSFVILFFIMIVMISTSLIIFIKLKTTKTIKLINKGK